MNPLIQLADAVAAHINNASLSRPVCAERCYQPTFAMADLQTLHVSVVPKSLSIMLADRATDVFELAVDVGVQQAINPDAPGELDGLMSLMDEIIYALRGQVLAGYPIATWVGITNEPVFAPEHLEQKRVFTSVLTVTYRLRFTRS